MTKTFIIILTCIINSVYSQIKLDTLNKYNDNRKKHGYWLTYLDTNLNACRDLKKAAYYGFDYYENGQLINPIQQFKNRIAKKVAFDKKPQIGNPTILDGKYVFYDKLGNVEYVEVFNNGTTVTKTAYTYKRKTNILFSREVIDYSKPYKNQINSFCFEYYLKSDTIPSVKWWQGKLDDGKWHRIPK